MIDIIRKNSLFFALYILTFFAVFFYELNKPLLDTTLYLGEHRSVFGDAFFSFWTLLGEAYPYLVIAFIFYFVNKDKKNALKIGSTGIVLLILTFILKELFEHPRPAAVLEDMGFASSFNFVDGIDLHKAPTSFPSGHTASAFALWGLMSFYFHRNRILQVVFFIMAFLVGFSRVYLTQHFPQDALFGSAIGIFIALLAEYYFDTNKKS
ncbi:MAG: phosphatase PAP2 family protein [Saprospiraceae bacterium]|nr:phosphatase PAP2 family protein [Saprospiraceae bacterium]